MKRVTGVLIAGLILGLVVLAARTWWIPPPPESMPPVWARVPDFQLTDQSGKRIRRSDLEGKVWIAAFLFTRCRAECPVMIENLGRLQEWMGNDERLRIVSFTVDPEHDTPEVLSDFAARIGADTTRWSFVTGDRDSIFALARNGFLLGVEAPGDAVGGDGDETVLHSNRLVLIDSDLKIRGTYVGLDADEIARLKIDADRLLAPGQS